MSITQPVTQTAVFVCVGQGYGLVDVSWVRLKIDNEKPRALRSKSIVTTMITPDNITTIISSLTIPNLKDNDGKRYRCTYNNSVGEMHSNPARLTIGSKCSHVYYDNVIDYFT